MSRRRGFRDGPDTHPEYASACPGPCNRAWRAAVAKAEQEALAETPDPAVIHHGKTPRPGGPVWCVDVTVWAPNLEGGPPVVRVAQRGCSERIIQELTELYGLAAHLTPGPLNTAPDVTGRHGSGGAGPSPSPGFDEADELVRWAVQLEDQVRSVMGTPLLDARVRRLGDAVRFLTAYGNVLLSLPDAADVGAQVTGWHRRLTRHTGRDLLVHRLPGTCLRCDRKGLEREDGADLVKCRRCGACWDWEQYEFLARAYADDVRRSG